MSGSDSELDADDFGLDDGWLNSVADIQQDPDPEPPEEKHDHPASKVVHRRDYASEAGATHGGEWTVAFKDPTGSHPFHEISLLGSAALVPESHTHSALWCGTMNDSLELEYLSYRGNILCQCLTSFRPGLMDDQNQQIWDVVKEFVLLNQTFVQEVSNQQSKLNIAMARLGSTAFQCSNQLENMMDICVAVAPFEKAVMELKNQSADLVDKNEMLKKEFKTLTPKLQEALIGDAGIKDATESVMNSAEELTAARDKYLKSYVELNTEVTEHKGRLVQLEQQLKDMKYSAALLKTHLKLLDDQTKDSEGHNFEMAKKETQAHDYFYERKRGDKVVYSHHIWREKAAKKTARRSEELQRVMREDSKSALKRLDKHLDAITELQREHATEKEKRKEAETVMKETLRQSKTELDQKERVYNRNLLNLQAATEGTGVIVKNLPLFLKAFQEIHFYNTYVQTVTTKVSNQVQAISDGLEASLRGYRLWDKPLSMHKMFVKMFKPMVRILNDQGITECGELATYHEERQMQRLMKSILPELRRNHRELLEEDGHSFRVGYEKAFHRACKQMSETPGYLRASTQDIGGYLSTSFSAFKRGQKLIKKPTAQTLQIELDRETFLPGGKMLAIKDSTVDEGKHDNHSSHQPKPKKKSAKDRLVE